MNTTPRVIAFGIVSGLIWSAIAAVLSGLHIGVAIVISGILTGVAVSLALKSPLQVYGRWSGFAFGALSLPVGAFVFGFVISLVQLAGSNITGSGDSQFMGASPNPIQIGMIYALFSVVSLFTVALLPLAILTTFILRAVIHKSKPAP